MASLICKYCGSYINDTDERCPNCDAVNQDYKRVSDGTPRTIEELKKWYEDRKLPPEETTRFFIGKNIKSPRAFGIYEENGRFIVYKNKSNGSRAIRYEGRDEAYAVNELYLRLKEEILNQKKNNSRKASVEKRPKSSLSTANDVRISNWDPKFEHAKPYVHNRPITPLPHRKQTTRKKSSIGATISVTLLFLVLTMFSIAGLFMGLSSDLFSDLFSDPHYHYYYMGSDNTMYFLDSYDSTTEEVSWWRFDEEQQTWNYYQSYATSRFDVLVGPDVVDVDTGCESVYDFATNHNKDYNVIDITKNHDFIDAGHRISPSMSYYSYNDKLYYYLDDTHSSYGSSDNSGWYIYENDEWQYYCSNDDHSTLGDDLWYHQDQYWVGDDYIDIYSYTDEYSYTWNATDFEDTDWYSNYEANEDAYQDYLDSQDDYDYNSGSDYDYDDYDWDYDYDYDWDSGGSDWDSDW